MPVALRDRASARPGVAVFGEDFVRRLERESATLAGATTLTWP